MKVYLVLPGGDCMQAAEQQLAWGNWAPAELEQLMVADESANPAVTSEVGEGA